MIRRKQVNEQEIHIQLGFNACGEHDVQDEDLGNCSQCGSGDITIEREEVDENE